jgi:hypothetical protein
LGKENPVLSDVGQLMTGQKIKFMDSRVVGMTDPNIDVQMKIDLVQQSANNNEQLQASGIVPVDVLKKIIAQDAAASKAFNVMMTDVQGHTAKLLIKIEFKDGKATHAEATEVKFEPASSPK